MTLTLKNRFSTDQWKKDSIMAIDLYNQWFMSSAPEAFRNARAGVIKQVISAIKYFDFFRNISIASLREHPEYLSVLRACTAPPLAIDRLVGLSGTTRNMVCSLEKGKLPHKSSQDQLTTSIRNILQIITKLIDYEIFPWLNDLRSPSAQMLNRSASIVADRVSGALADPIIRNSQERRQLNAIDNYLEQKGYIRLDYADITSIDQMPAFSYAHHLNVPVEIGGKYVNMPIDMVIQPQYSGENNFPLLIECKSAGDFANTNKRRKEEAIKASQLRHTYGQDRITYILFLCGYFDTSYLGYEASEGIDWVWEHRITDFSAFGI